MSKPWDVYAQELEAACCLGYPMWDPEPEESGEVRIGDVGYISEGRFHRLFNATCPADDEINELFGVPDGYKPLPLRDNLYEDRVPRNLQLGPCLSSNSIISMEVSGEAKGKGIGGALHFECTEDRGAILAMPQEVANRQKLRQNRLISRWLRKYHRSWWQWATDTLYLDLREDEIIFVSGWVKTADWAVGAFVDRGQAVKLRLHGGHDAVAGASFSLTMSGGVSRTWFQRSGPSTGTPRRSASSAAEDTPPTSSKDHKESHCPADEDTFKSKNHRDEDTKLDQCVFLHYSGFQERLGGILPKFLPKKLKAAAEDYEFPRMSDDDDDDFSAGIESSNVSVEGVYEDMCSNIPPRHDPVDIVLKYILEHSNASCATASTDDVINLYKMPQNQHGTNFQEILLILAPQIDVDEDGLGTLDLDALVSKHESDIPTDIICAVVDDKLPDAFVSHDLDNPDVPTDTDDEYGDSSSKSTRAGINVQNRPLVHARPIHPLPSMDFGTCPHRDGVRPLEKYVGHYSLDTAHLYKDPFCVVLSSPSMIVALRMQNLTQTARLPGSESSNTTPWPPQSQSPMFGSPPMYYDPDHVSVPQGSVPYEHWVQSVGYQPPEQHYNFAPYQHPNQLSTATPPQSYMPLSKIVSSWGRTISFLTSASTRASSKTASSGEKAQNKSGTGRKGQGKKRARPPDGQYTHDTDSASDGDNGFGMINVSMLSMAGSDSRPTRLPGACKHCKKLKMKCDFPPGENTCRRCKQSGNPCIVEGRKSRNAPNKREYLLAQIRQKDVIIKKLLRELHNPYSATPLSIASYRMATSPSNENNDDLIAWLDLLEASVHAAGSSGGVDAFKTKSRAQDDAADDSDGDQDENDPHNNTKRGSIIGEDDDASKNAEDQSQPLPDATVPLGLLASLALSQHLGRGKKGKERTGGGDSSDDDNAGVASDLRGIQIVSDQWDSHLMGSTLCQALVTAQFESGMLRLAKSHSVQTYFVPGPAYDLSIWATLVENHGPPETFVHGLLNPDEDMMTDVVQRHTEDRDQLSISHETGKWFRCPPESVTSWPSADGSSLVLPQEIPDVSCDLSHCLFSQDFPRRHHNVEMERCKPLMAHWNTSPYSAFSKCTRHILSPRQPSLRARASGQQVEQDAQCAGPSQVVSGEAGASVTYNEKNAHHSCRCLDGPMLWAEAGLSTTSIETVSDIHFMKQRAAGTSFSQGLNISRPPSFREPTRII